MDPGLDRDLNVLMHKQFQKMYNMMCCKLSQIAAGGAATQSIQFTIGDGGANTPANGSTVYNNSALQNKSMDILLNGYGFMVLGTDFSINAGGGFTLLGGRTFNTGETYTILYH